jgi:hypothetical protein
MKGDGPIWYIIGVIIVFLLIGDGIHGVRNRKHHNQAYFIFSVGMIIIGITVLMGLIFIYIKLGRIS